MKGTLRKLLVVWLVFGQALSMVLPVRGQSANSSLFQYAIFYNGLLEFSDCAPMTVNGPVHCNSNIYVGCISSSSLTFDGMVTASGTITNPPNAGFAQSSWVGPISYKGTPAPGYETGAPELYYMGSNAQQILYPPPSGENPHSVLGLQRYYNKAGMTILISNVNNTATYTITLKNSPTDPNPVVFTNLCSTLSNATSAFPWLTVTSSLHDWRENKTIYLTQIDVGKLSNWMYTNIYVYNFNALNKFNSNTSPLNVIWVGDWRYSNSAALLSAIRVMDGATLPPAGLTIATPNPLYVWGNYNAPSSANLGTTNVTGTAPASFASDALTILSSNWSDSASPSQEGTQTASSTTVNAAIITGDVPSTGTTATTFSGGVHNLVRLQENWSSQTLTLNTSLVCLFKSSWATGQFLLPATYYLAPTRQINFNHTYNSFAGLPPGTPSLLPVTVTSINPGAPTIRSDGSFQLCFTNTPAASFTILSSTNPAVPLTNWTVMGTATEISAGQYQFVDSQATNEPQRFYRIRSP